MGNKTTAKKSKTAAVPEEPAAKPKETPSLDKQTLASSKKLAAQLGFTYQPPLPPSVVQRFVKPLPGYALTLDNIAKQLGVDQDALNLADLSPQMLLDLQAQLEKFGAFEPVLNAVALSLYQQRMQADNDAMLLVLKINRRVNSRKEEDPDLYNRWQFLRTYLATFYQGRGNAKPDAEEPAAGEDDSGEDETPPPAATAKTLAAKPAKAKATRAKAKTTPKKPAPKRPTRRGR